MLKFRVPFVAGLWDELFFRLLVRFFGLFCMLGSTDFKVFVAYSSIIHMTVFCLGLRILSRGIFDYFIVPHTLLSRCIFWFFGGVYAKKGVRLFTFFGGYRPGSLVLL
jgi:NADH:ubiquinone oxidoreductase subunit 4 (subunit M)